MVQDGHRPSTLRIGGWLPRRSRSDEAATDRAAVTELIPVVAEPLSAYPEPVADIDATRASGGPVRRRTRRTVPLAATIAVAVAMAAAVATGTPLLLDLRSHQGAPRYMEPAPSVAWADPERPGPGAPRTAPSGSRPPPPVTATPTGPGGRPPGPRGANPSAASGDKSTMDPQLFPPEPAGRPAPVNLSFEAESLRMSGLTRPKRNGAASGGRVVGWVGNGPGNTLRLALTVPDTGMYSVVLFYVAATSREATVRVNRGKPVVQSFPPTGDGPTVSAVTLRLELRAGSNTIELGNPVAYGPDFDRVSVTR